ncbi:MAG: sigma-54 interaction domain-containing protein [Negativicutes bacterium]
MPDIFLKKLRDYLQKGEYKQIEDMFQQVLDSQRLQQDRLAAVLDTVNEAVTIVDADNKVVAWNARAELLYGIKAAEILQQPIAHFFSNLMVSEVIQHHGVVSDKYHAPCPGTHVLINARTIMSEDRMVGGVSAERDITELVQLNQQLSETNQEMQSLKKTLNDIHTQKDPFFSIHGRGEAIRNAVSLARRVAMTSVPVLLRGESGTGKELFARAIHEASQVSGPYVAINCGAIPANLFESELFGYQPGAFTGADRKGKGGLLEKANGGTVLLDEVGDLPREMQVKLLRTLQEKSLYRVGGNESIPVDFRVIAATNRNLEEMIRAGEFREDLYYRLNVVAISLPPLRERLDDIPELFHRGLQYYCALHNKNITRIDPSLMTALVQYQWPGNIREFLNVLERIVILAEGDTLGIDDLPHELIHRAFNRVTQEERPSRLSDATDGLERDSIARILAEVGYNKSVAAQKLGIPRSTLYYKIHKLGIGCQ